MANIFTTIPEKEPISFYKGETIVWKRTDIGADYDPSSYSMVWEASLESDGSTRFSATVTESGTDYTFTLDNSSTASYTAGDYVWFLKVLQTSDSETLVIDSGKITVKDNYFATTGDTRSHAKVMLDKIESILENRADADVSSYSIAGRSLNKLSVDELLRWRDYYRAEYKKEVAEFRTGNNEGSGRVVKVQFNDIS
jgi:hypothetical protein|tara:strand:- start:130 stop:720 length:591 start_codon:yes stop_codon:yes gene_type:complete